VKQFTEQELENLLNVEYTKGHDEGFNDGYSMGSHDTSFQYRKRLANQRRELRRLNKKIEYLHMAFKAGAAVFDDRVAVEMKMKQQRRAA
jgi:hypothetical protein